MISADGFHGRSQGHGIYQTNHGSAYDLAGKNLANPAGQFFSLAMLLRESFGLKREADLIEESVRQAWKEGRVTSDIQQAGCTCVGTRELGDLVLENLRRLLKEDARLENDSITG